MLNVIYHGCTLCPPAKLLCLPVSSQPFVVGSGSCSMLGGCFCLTFGRTWGIVYVNEPLNSKRRLCHFWTNRVVGNVSFCNSCRIQCRKLNLISLFCHGVMAILIKANMWDCVYLSIFKHTFLQIAQNDIGTCFWI